MFEGFQLSQNIMSECNYFLHFLSNVHFLLNSATMHCFTELSRNIHPQNRVPDICNGYLIFVCFTLLGTWHRWEIPWIFFSRISSGVTQDHELPEINYSVYGGFLASPISFPPPPPNIVKHLTYVIFEYNRCDLK